MSKILTFGGYALTVGNHAVEASVIAPPPEPLPANTVRVRTNDGNAPIKDASTSYETATLVAGTTDVYDVYKSGTDFTSLLYKSSNVIEVIGANTSNVTNMQQMFRYCSALTTVSLFDTSNVTDMSYMFDSCSALTTVPLFNTSKVTTLFSMFFKCSVLTAVPLFNTSNVTNMGWMFTRCYKVESGALALYQQASSQTTPPSNHDSTFKYCGRDTVTGAAELAQIPSDWK